MVKRILTWNDLFNWEKKKESSLTMMKRASCSVSRLDIRSLTLALLFTTLVSCSVDGSQELDLNFVWESNALLGSAKLEKLKEIVMEDSLSTFLYGQLTIRNRTGECRLYNISAFQLIADSSRLSNVYYSGFGSYIDVVIQDERIGPFQIVQHDVYWAFWGRLTDAELDGLRVDTSGSSFGQTGGK